MKQVIGEWLSSRQGKISRGMPFHWGGGEIVLAVIIILGILSLGSGMVGKWINAAGDNGILPVSLHSLSEADYSVDEIIHSVPAIGLEIIRDLLGLNRSSGTGGSPEIAVIVPLSHTPTPTATVFGLFPSGITPTTEVPVDPTATDKPGSTATSIPRPSATKTNFPTLNPTETPSSPTPPPAATKTKTPSPTPGKIATNTIVPTQMPPTKTPTQVPTNPPAPVPTSTSPNPTSPPPPASSPTAHPTRSSTLAVTPTAKYTPGITGEPP